MREFLCQFRFKVNGIFLFVWFVDREVIAKGRSVVVGDQGEKDDVLTQGVK